MLIPSDVTELLKVIVWPLTLLIVLILFRRPLAHFLSGLSGRVTKISVLQFSLEFAKAPVMRPTWEIGQTDVRRLTPDYLFDSPSGRYFEQLRRTSGEYAVIDLGQGDQWISSRLFIFAVLLARMTRIRQFVFLSTQEGVADRFLGMASPGEVRWALARRYPWLEGAYAYAYASMWPQGDSGQLLRNWKANWDQSWIMLTGRGEFDSGVAREIAYIFVGAIQQHEPPPDSRKAEWVEAAIDGTLFWERATRLDEAWLRQELPQALDRERGTVDSPDLGRIKRVQAVVRRSGRYVALLDGNWQFQSLVDRYELLDRFSPEMAELVGD